MLKKKLTSVVESVIAHEYAHAIMFKLGHIHNSDDGHSREWEETCQKLGGKDCQRYVDQKEIIMSKMPF